MTRTLDDASPSTRGHSLVAHIVLACIAMAVAVIVRLPSASLWGATSTAREAYTSQSGLPYLTEVDSYYHVRLVENHLEHGTLGDVVREDGTEWDTQSFFPEGRSAEYSPGIVWVTEAIWRVARLFGVSLESVEYCFSVVLAAAVAAAAYAVGARMAGPVGGLAAGVLSSCAPAFVSRSVFGRFDTDGLVILMDVLLVLCMTEALRARTTRRLVGWSCGFGLCTLAYALCWAPRYAVLFAGLVLLGGVGAVVARALASLLAGGGVRSALARMARAPEPRAVLLCIVVTVVGTLVAFGPALLASVFSAVQRTAAVTTSGELPNLYASISELRVPEFATGGIYEWFAGYSLGGRMTVLAGAGGATAAILCVVGTLLLAVGCVSRSYRATRVLAGAMELPCRSACASYLCVVGLLLAGSVYASFQGVRFVEHLSVPCGILAGACVGWVCEAVTSHEFMMGWRKGLVAAAMCAVAAFATLAGANRACTGSRPSVTDASATGMQWIQQNAQDPSAVVVSWWDKGYFYESESGHPCLWDGGCQDGLRAILVCKALTADNYELGRDILRMLAGSGNVPVKRLMERVGAREAIEATMEALPLRGAEAQEVLVRRCGLSAEEAAQIEELLHPSSTGEIYLVLTNSMMKRLGWFEYYADWDYAGGGPTPANTSYDRTHSGGLLNQSEEGRQLLETRTQQVIWRLMLGHGTSELFEPVFDQADGIEHVRIWRVG